jgi:hypothetical protein
VNESLQLLTTAQKALTINLDRPQYGTFAEIGAGQEVAREFVLAGAASQRWQRQSSAEACSVMRKIAT